MTARTFIIAEAGVNHNGSLDMAKALIDGAVAAGVDAVKFQTFRAASLAGVTAPKARYQKESGGDAESQFEMLRRLELNHENHRELAAYCANRGIEFMSTPFDLDSARFLIQDLGVRCIKISSGDITNGPLLLACAQSGLDIILSTGMSTLADIEVALGMLAFGYLGSAQPPSLDGFRLAYANAEGQEILLDRVTLLHCTTEYPAPFAGVNLKAMDTLSQAFGLQVGYSDHTQGIAVPIASVARGARVIEKHFTLDRNLPGPDHQASLEPRELRAMVRSIREVEQALGNGRKIPALAEIDNIGVARKSLVASQAISKGSLYSEGNLTAKRPGNGISPVYFWDMLGRVAPRDYDVDEMVEI